MSVNHFPFAMTNEVKSIEDELMCGICHEILIEPMVLVCNHLFCEFCLVKWLVAHTDCPMCRATVPRDPDDPGQLVVFSANAERVIDHVVRALPPLVQEQRRAAKRLREQAVERDASAKKRKLNNPSPAGGRLISVETVVSFALAAVMGTLTLLF